MNYGLCAGLIYENNILIEEHKFFDGKEHEENSHGLCEVCADLTRYLNNMYVPRERKEKCKVLMDYLCGVVLTAQGEELLTKEGGLLDKLTR